MPGVGHAVTVYVVNTVVVPRAGIPHVPDVVDPVLDNGTVTTVGVRAHV